MNKTLLLLGLLVGSSASCDDVESGGEREDAYAMGLALRLSGSAEACPPKMRCLELCTFYSDGTEQATGVTCCVDESYAELSTDPEAFAQCLENRRFD